MTKQVPVLLVQLSAVSLVVLYASIAAAQGGGVSLEVRGELNAGATSGLEQHVQNLGATDPAVRLEAARALGELGDPAAVAPLSQTARSDPRPEVRGWALRSLQQLGTPEAMATIREVAGDDADERVRELASQLLASSQPAAAPAPAPAAAPSPAAAPAPAAAPTGAPAASATVVVQQQTGVAQTQPQGVVMPQEVQTQSDYYTLRLQRRAGRGLRIGGWITFGVTYGICFMAGIGVSAVDDASEGWPLFIPAVGPFIMGARMIREANDCTDDDCGHDDGEAVGGAFTIIVGLLQVAGIAMFSAGYARRSRAMREGVTGERPSRQIALLPGGPGGGPGMSFAGTF